MSNRLIEIFEDEKLIERIQKRLPHLFQLAEFESSKRLFDKIGRKEYIKLPQAGTNPRGVEITKEALTKLVEDSVRSTKFIKINWQ